MIWGVELGWGVEAYFFPPSPGQVIVCSRDKVKVDWVYGRDTGLWKALTLFLEGDNVYSLSGEMRES